mmetsp:Transcript_1648/g.2153  ORF Transcript_1648/g.2153 Transcript_1648/m.2153 type:complete len:107 (-) Transcript_1648:17-337(-)
MLLSVLNTNNIKDEQAVGETVLELRPTRKGPHVDNLEAWKVNPEKIVAALSSDIEDKPDFQSTESLAEAAAMIKRAVIKKKGSSEPTGVLPVLIAGPANSGKSTFV